MTASSLEARPRNADRLWLGVSLILAVLLGVAVVDQMKVALAAVVLFLAVIVPLLVLGVRLRATVLLLLVILYLAPGIRIASDLPIVMGDEALLYITAILMMAAALVETRGVGWPAMPAPGKALMFFFPLTLLSMAYGAARFGINPIRGDYFEFVKFGKYVLAIYIASCVRVNRRFLVTFSWVTAVGAFVAAATAILQAFDFPGVRSAFQLVYYSANPQKVGDFLADRASGTIGNPNELALFLGAGLAFTITLLHLEKRPAQRAFLWLFAVADLLSILLSGSRMGLGCAAVAMVLLVSRSKRRYATVILIGGVGALVFVVVLLAVAEKSGNLPGFLAVTLHPLFNRAERFSTGHLGDIFNRVDMWKIAWSQTQASLLLGYGPAKGALDLMTSKTTDSEIFIVALRYGLVGLVIWAGIWAVFLRTGRRAAASPEPTRALVGRALWVILFVNLLACSVNYTFLALRRMTLICIFVGLAAAIVRADRADAAVIDGSAKV